GGCDALNHRLKPVATAGALLQSANSRLGRGRIRDRNFEILYLVLPWNVEADEASAAGLSRVRVLHALRFPCLANAVMSHQP
ncbi:MAG: hypothetical protein AB1733_23655, partial [Thermodesulfobacteriota bacterium]